MAACAAASSLAGSAYAADPLDKVERSVLDQLGTNKEATFWAVLAEKANLAPAPGLMGDARGRFVYDELNSVADRSQAGLRGFLKQRGAAYKPFWIINAIKITGDLPLLREVAARPEVEQVLADRVYELPKPLPGTEEPTIDVVEWNILRIRAPEAWTTFGTRGEGMVVANIDTGVMFNHAAVVQQYRGNLGGGNFNHNYNWFDPSRICGNPSLVPCDNNGHGTHTMGTMVGDDGDPGPNQIGVAPHARWIAAKGCESSSCSTSALLASGQWVLAPTDLAGLNPDPSRRPHVVNNSWGGGGGDPWYQATVAAWVASGIFPAFSNGNSGPSCARSGSPGDYVNSYSAGAFDINNNIAGFSSRGPSAFGGELKPNNAAPGVNVRSAWNNGGYNTISGTSMASPHNAATVALMWSAAPAIERDIGATRTILDDSAVDTSDLTCGGTADDNNVWGEGKLDAFAAVDQSPRGPTGTLAGTVTNASDGTPIAGATVRAVGPTTRVTTTNATGAYSLTLPVGTYDVTASAFGFLTQTATGVVISEGQTTTQNFALQPAPSHSVSGTVRDTDANPIENATVTILNTPIPPATTDANGNYSFASVPEGEYDVRAEAGRCNTPQTRHLVVSGPVTGFDFALPQRSDSFGYFCRIQGFAYVPGETRLALSGDDASTAVTLPFAFTFYGQSYSTAHVSTNGFLNFLAPNASFSNGSIPSTGTPNAAIYPFWDDLFVDAAAGVFAKTEGTAPNRRFIIEWRNVAFCCITVERVTFSITLFENGRMLFQYQDAGPTGREHGDSATVGIENESGTVALQYSFNEAALSNSLAILFRLPPSAFVEGHVTDANDGQAVSAATVRALQGGTEVRRTTTNAAGFYRMQLRLGTYTIEASKTNYSTESAGVVLDAEDAIVTQNFVLRTARAAVSPEAFEIIAPQGEQRTRTLRLSNTGTLDMTWEIRESGGGTASGRVEWLERSDTGVAMESNAGGTAEAFPSAAKWIPDTPSPAQPRILVYADDFFHRAPNTYVDQALRRLSLAYTAFYDGNFSGFENALRTGGPWDVVVFEDDNFAPPTSTFDALNTYAQGGGKLVINSWRVSAHVTHPLWTTLGFQFVSNDGDPPDPINWWQPDHPAFTDPESVPELTQLQRGRYGIYGQRVQPLEGFEALAGYTETETPSEAALVLGNDNRTLFKGFMDGQNDADLDGDGLRDGMELWVNLIVGIEQGFFADVPWLSEDPTSGTLAPGASQDIQVRVDATGLAPGVYEAKLTIRSNSGRRPTLRVPVRLIVPAYQQGVNAGDALYTDLLGDPWAPDRLYAAGSWGYTSRSSNEHRTRRPISGTLDDPLYQYQRIDPVEYRFDAVPAGVYQIELRFAELQGRPPNTRLFDVIVEGVLVLPAHDIAAEVGNFAADDETFFLPITDGQANVRFVARRGYAAPVINGLRVTHRPDR